MNHIDTELYRAIINDEIDVLKDLESRLKFSDQLTPANNTLLHLACQYGSINCVKHILSVHESLLFEINSRGETALHLAARQGQCDVVVAIINTAKSSIQNLLRIPDVELETALHVAVRYNHNNVVELLVKEDSIYEYPPNKNHETPLYLASLRCYRPIVKTILDGCKSPTFCGPDGKTALHAAVCDDDKYGCVKLLLEKSKALAKVVDNYGWTAFHYAACNNSPSVVEALVAADKSAGYLVEDEYKRTALHIAAYKGNDRVMTILMEHYPDCWEIVDANGQNILHIAAEQDQKHIIRYILLRSSKTYNNLLIQRDKEGNTPLHLMARRRWNLAQLTDADLNVDWGVLNQNNFTPLELLHCKEETGTVAGQVMIKRTRIDANTKIYQDLWDESEETDEEKGHTKGFFKTNEEQLEEYNKQYGTHMIVAALITTVALTAGFAMPGGFDEKEGSAVLARNTAFQTFIVTDTIALLLSMSTLFMYFVKALVKDAHVAGKFVLASAWLNVLSIITMMLAFTTGTYAVLAPTSALAISVCVISSIFFLVVPIFAYLVFVLLLKPILRHLQLIALM